MFITIKVVSGESYTRDMIVNTEQIKTITPSDKGCEISLIDTGKTIEAIIDFESLGEKLISKDLREIRDPMLYQL